MGDSLYGPDKGGAWAVLSIVLISFTFLACISREYIPVPKFLRTFLVPKSDSKGSSEDFFLSARSSADATTIALSFFASGMGAWVLYGTTEMGANPQLSWLGVIGYSSSSAIPALIICLIGPKVREMCGEKAFGSTDFARKRYGRVMQLSVACISVFYMFIFIVAELTSISNIYGMLVGVDVRDPSTTSYTRWIGIVVALATFFYSAVAGLPASIVTDKVQGVMMITLVIILLIAVTAQPENRVTNAEFNLASNFTIDGLMAWVTLLIAIASAEMFNQGNWQRVWAAKDIASLRKGFATGSAMVFLLMFFFGIMGMIAYANAPDAYDSFGKLAYLSFFDLLENSPTGVNYLVLILVTSLAASSIDTLQNAILSVFSHDILAISCCTETKIGNFSIGAYTTRSLLLVMNIPAFILAARRVDVLTLFLVADLVCATAVFPLFLGLISEKKLGGIFTPITEVGAFLGIMSAMSAVLINGAILGVSEARDIFGGVLGTGPFAYFWLANGDICALCGSKTMITFIVTPLAGALGAIIFSHIDILIRGEKNARKPIMAIFGWVEDETVEGKKDAFKDEVA